MPTKNHLCPWNSQIENVRRPGRVQRGLCSQQTLKITRLTELCSLVQYTISPVLKVIHFSTSTQCRNLRLFKYWCRTFVFWSFSKSTGQGILNIGSVRHVRNKTGKYATADFKSEQLTLP